MPRTTMLQVEEKEHELPQPSLPPRVIQMHETAAPHHVVYQRLEEAELYVWNLNQQTQSKLYCTSHDPRRIAVSPHLPHIYECADDIIVRDLHTGRELWRFSPPQGFSFTHVVAGPEPNQVGVLIESQTYTYFSIWGVESGKEGIHIPLFRTPTRQGCSNIHCIQVSPDSEMLLIQRHGQLHRWSLSTGQRLPPLPCTPPHVQALAFSRKAPLLATLYNKEVAVWNWERPRHNPLLFTVQGHFQAIALSPCGRVLATGDAQGAIKLWRVDRGLQLRQWSASTSVSQLLFTKDGKELLAGHNNGTVGFWDTESLLPSQHLAKAKPNPLPHFHTKQAEEQKILKLLDEPQPTGASPVPMLQRLLLQWEATHGITDLHRWISHQVVSRSQRWRFQHHHTLPQGSLRFGLNRERTYLAVWCFAEYNHGTQPHHVQLWEVASGRCVKNVDLTTLHNLWSAADPRTLLPPHFGTFERPILLECKDEGTAWGANYTTLVRWHHRHLQFLNTTPGQRRALLHCADLQSSQPSAVQSPLSVPPANLGDLSSPNAAFAVQHPSSQWDWVVAFGTGLVICPPRAVKELRQSVNLVLDERHAWPTHWLIGTPWLECHGTWQSALQSSKLPRPFPRLLQKLRRA